MPPDGTSRTLSRWADLPQDLLGDISGRLREATDFTRFHAVCTPWRDALLSLETTAASRLPFLPWLLTSSKGRILHCSVDFGRTDSSEMSSMSSYQRSREDVVLLEPAGVSFVGDSDRNWVTSADGKAAWLFFTDAPRLLNVLTGSVTRLPKFQQDLRDPRRKLPMENLRGIVYGDGTIFLYNFIHEFGGHAFTAAILRPNNNAAWTFVNRTLHLSSRSGEPGAAYHDGKILMFAGAWHWCVLALDDSSPDGHRLESWWGAGQGRHNKYLRGYCYVLESKGELLWVSVLVKQDNRGGNTTDEPARALSLTVHALEEAAVGGGGRGSGKMRWAARDGRTFVDRVLLLGAPASIVVHDAQLSVDGGCAYFVFRRGLFRYSFVDGDAKLVKQLRPVHGTDKACVWLQPQPAIAPMHEIRKRIEAPKKKKQKTCPNW